MLLIPCNQIVNTSAQYIESYGKTKEYTDNGSELRHQ
jgi:hypothetical protein